MLSETMQKTRLFDTSACKWIFEVCSCDKNRTVPSAELTFLHDQKTLRLVAIGGVDKFASKKIAIMLLRKAKELRTVRSTNMQFKVNAPLWFSIRMHPSCKDGARHLFRTIQLSILGIMRICRWQ